MGEQVPDDIPTEGGRAAAAADLAKAEATAKMLLLYPDKWIEHLKEAGGPDLQQAPAADVVRATILSLFPQLRPRFSDPAPPP